jgi:carboxylesterase
MGIGNLTSWRITVQLPYFSAFEPVPRVYHPQLMAEALPKHFKVSPSVRAVIICLHGFTGMPYEVLPIAEACGAHGLNAAVPLLPGHGYGAADAQRQFFPKITMEHMHEVAREEIQRARQQYDFVGMFGLSMGGAIALTMASEGRLDACVAAAPALLLPPMAERLIPVLGWANFFIRKRKVPGFYLPCYPFYHSWSLRELRRIGRHATAHLSKIHCPVCVVHSHSDRTISPIVADWIVQRVPNPVEVEWFDESGHCLPLDVQGKSVAKHSAQFFRRVVTRHSWIAESDA